MLCKCTHSAGGDSGVLLGEHGNDKLGQDEAEFSDVVDDALELHCIWNVWCAHAMVK